MKLVPLLSTLMNNGAINCLSTQIPVAIAIITFSVVITMWF